jgi:NAD(P)-dependent dehydrogenase (short-subunit alcohol dehydrogenase family)
MTEQRTLLLTGASRGIGHATVQRFNAAGWRVITCSRHPFPAECPWGGGEDNHIQIDLADPKDVIEKVEEIRARLGGRLDALVNNAGISPKGPEGERLDTISTDLRTWGQVFHVNFFAPVVLARSLKNELAAARSRARGCIPSQVPPMPPPRLHWPR